MKVIQDGKDKKKKDDIQDPKMSDAPKSEKRESYNQDEVLKEKIKEFIINERDLFDRFLSMSRKDLKGVEKI